MIVGACFYVIQECRYKKYMIHSVSLSNWSFVSYYVFEAQVIWCNAASVQCRSTAGYLPDFCALLGLSLLMRMFGLLFIVASEHTSHINLIWRPLCSLSLWANWPQSYNKRCRQREWGKAEADKEEDERARERKERKEALHSRSNGL